MFQQKEEHFFCLGFLGGLDFFQAFLLGFFGVSFFVLLLLGEGVFGFCFQGCFVQIILKLYKDTQTLTKMTFFLNFINFISLIFSEYLSQFAPILKTFSFFYLIIFVYLTFIFVSHPFFSLFFSFFGARLGKQKK